MRRTAARFFVLLSVVAAVATTAGLVRADPLADRVVIVANASDADSLAVARHYADVRHVPAANLVALPMPATETVDWKTFVTDIWSPLQAELVQRGWIDAIGMDLTDEAGRRKYAMSGHRIAYLVVCRGVPLRIAGDEALFKASPKPSIDQPAMRTNQAAVDSEFALLAHASYTTSGFIANPLYRNDQPGDFEREAVIKVSRLDGPTPQDAMALVDHAIEAEQHGVVGRAYVDIGGAHPQGDRWLEDDVKQLAELGFDTDVDRAKTTMPVTARFDAPAIYLGWYSGAVTGPFLLPDFRFPAGAIAVHIHSSSASTLHSATANWCGPLIACGVTATVGNVFEPYLEFTHHLDLLLRALARGDTFGDAACYAMPVFSWQAIAIGDPLYRPLVVPVEEQWKNRAALPPRLAGYVTVRQMIALERQKRPDEALALARQAQADAPSLAVAIALAERLQAAGDAAGAANALGFLPMLKTFRPDEWAVARRGAELLAAGGRPQRAADVYANLLDEVNLPRDLRLLCLREARQAAIAGQDMVRAVAWQKEIDARAVDLSGDAKK